MTRYRKEKFISKYKDGYIPNTYFGTGRETKDRHNLYLFMEKHKIDGKVSIDDLIKYIKSEKYKARFIENVPRFGQGYTIFNKYGTALGTIWKKQDNKVFHWIIL